MTRSSTWLIRCHDEASVIDACITNDTIAAPFPTVDNVTSLDTEAITSQIDETLNEQDRRRLATELSAFASDVSQQDLVLVPDKNRQRFLVGRVTGEYHWEDEAELRHRRDVEWLSSLPWDKVPLEFKSIANYRRMVLRVDNPALDAACDEALEAPLSKADLLGVRKSSTSKSPIRKAAAKPPKSTSAPQERRCAACGLKKHIAQFSDSSDRCVDCE